MSLYYPYSAYLKNKYGKKTYKLPVNLPVSCPNRDGNLGTGAVHFVVKREQDLRLYRQNSLSENSLKRTGTISVKNMEQSSLLPIFKTSAIPICHWRN